MRKRGYDSLRGIRRSWQGGLSTSVSNVSPYTIRRVRSSLTVESLAVSEQAQDWHGGILATFWPIASTRASSISPATCQNPPPSLLLSRLRSHRHPKHLQCASLCSPRKTANLTWRWSLRAWPTRRGGSTSPQTTSPSTCCRKSYSVRLSLSVSRECVADDAQPLLSQSRTCSSSSVARRCDCMAFRHGTSASLKSSASRSLHSPGPQRLIRLHSHEPSLSILGPARLSYRSFRRAIATYSACEMRKGK